METKTFSVGSIVQISTSVKKEHMNVPKTRFAQIWMALTNACVMMASNVLVRSVSVSKRMFELISHDLQISMSVRSFAPAHSGV